MVVQLKTNEMMRIPRAALVISFGFAAMAVHGQAAPPASQTPAAPAAAAQPTMQSEPAPPPAATPPVTASSLLQPSLTQTQGTLSSLKIDKWKKGSVRDEAGGNVNALLRDLQTNLPPLLTAADAEPGSVSRAVPLMKHLDAFYDVLLRVEEGSRVSAPPEQVDALQQTMLAVNKARIAYDDLLQAQAASQEKQVFAMQTQLQAQKETIASQQDKITAATATPPPCKPGTTPARKKKKTTTTTTAKPSPATPAAPQPQ